MTSQKHSTHLNLHFPHLHLHIYTISPSHYFREDSYTIPLLFLTFCFISSTNFGFLHFGLIDTERKGGGEEKSTILNALYCGNSIPALLSASNFLAVRSNNPSEETQRQQLRRPQGQEDQLYLDYEIFCDLQCTGPQYTVKV